MWVCFLMSGVKILHFLKDWWKSIPIHQNYTMALKTANRFNPYIQRIQSFVLLDFALFLCLFLLYFPYFDLFFIKKYCFPWNYVNSVFFPNYV